MIANLASSPCTARRPFPPERAPTFPPARAVRPDRGRRPSGPGHDALRPAHGVIGLSIATVLFDRMAAAAAEHERESLVSSSSSSLRVTGVATVFCMVALIVYAGPLGMLFSGGVPRRAP
ncbi:hypothetical protein QJS66_14275 [Kocuria rhizophila]|nr:hypothetical protein QJS66_14275 [Kocuria rhizophila]